MAFRKRHVIVPSPNNLALSSSNTTKEPIPGTRPSPLDGRLTTSTGTQSFDSLLAGHSGLVLGTSLLIEESGTTDFGGILLRYFAAEGVIQGHQVHVLSMNEAWGSDLPGISGIKEKVSASDDEKRSSVDRMKIAWRYERLGEIGRGGRSWVFALHRAPVMPSSNSHNQQIFCHDFDLSKRLMLPSPSLITYVSHTSNTSSRSEFIGNIEDLFSNFIQNLTTQVGLFPKSIIHRIVIPSLLSPAIYPTTASTPEQVLRFLHSLRALLRKHPTQLTALITLPLTLHPRETGLTRWIEILNDGVIELAPFPSHVYSIPAAGNNLEYEETAQGMLKVHSLPILHEKGGGGNVSSSFGDDLVFTLSKRKGLIIKPFSLPPVGGDADTQHIGKEIETGRTSRLDIDF